MATSTKLREKRTSETVQHGLDIANGLLTLGSAIPCLGGVCNAAKDVLNVVETVKKCADDVLAAGRRVVDILLILRMMANNTKRLDDPLVCQEIELRMRALELDLLSISYVLVSLSGDGFLKKMVKLFGKRSKKLASLDTAIRDSLDGLCRIYGLARDATTLELLRRREYPLEAMIEKYVNLRLEDGKKQSEDCVRTELASDVEFAVMIVRSGSVDGSVVYEHLDGVAGENERAEEFQALIKTQAAKLATACYEGDVDVARQVLEKRLVNAAVPTQIDSTSWEVTPLHLACISGKLEVVKLLIEEYEVGPNQPDEKQRTPFYHAAAHDRTDVAAYLLEKESVSIDAGDNQGRTALMRAAQEARPDTLKWLLEHGALPSRVDPLGSTALDYAYEEMTTTQSALRDEQRRSCKISAHPSVDLLESRLQRCEDAVRHLGGDTNAKRYRATPSEPVSQTLNPPSSLDFN